MRRQKLSRTDKALEEVGIKAAGLKKECIAPIIIVLFMLLLTFIFFTMKILTWTLLVVLNVVFLAYLIHVCKKTPEDIEEEEAVYYQDNTGRTVVSKKVAIKKARTVNKKRIFK